MDCERDGHLVQLGTGLCVVCGRSVVGSSVASGDLTWTENDLWVKTRVQCSRGHRWSDLLGEAVRIGCPECGSTDVRPVDD